MRLRRCLLVAILGLAPLPACKGNGDGSPTSPSPGTPTNPCSNALTAEQPEAPVNESVRQDKREAVDRDTRYRVFDALSLHREAAQWR
jgi:hypothetical protein